MTAPDEKDLEFRLCQYLDGQLGRREQAEMDRRLEADPALRAELRRYAALDGYLTDIDRREIEGVDYDGQREEIVSAVERKVLLAPARRRVIRLRPAVVLAAAAAVLLAVSAALFLLAPPGGQPPAATALMEVLPAQGGDGPVEVVVQMRPVHLDEMPLVLDLTPAAAAPAGTIVVSIGAGTAPHDDPADAMVVY